MVPRRPPTLLRTSTLQESEGRLTMVVIEYDENGERRVVYKAGTKPTLNTRLSIIETC